MCCYYIKYQMNGSFDDEKGIPVVARNKFEAYDKAVYELIPKKEGRIPYAAWVHSVTYANGNDHKFKTHSGKPY